jgi:catechol 2,3-dioxygenase-like lactoylglutathione lyase family enzyme
MSNYPRTISHVGISVPDVENAVEFYREVMGWFGRKNRGAWRQTKNAGS